IEDYNEDDDFIITPIQQTQQEEKSVDTFDDEEQVTLTFDFPLSSQSFDEEETTDDKILFELEDEVKDLKVNDHIEIIPVTEANEEGEKRYALDDFMSYESSM